MLGQGRNGFRARWMLPLAGPAVEDAAVWIEGGRVAWAGRAKEAPAGFPPPRDLGEGVFLPAPVNAHTHLEFSAPAAPIARRDGFPAWVRRMLASPPPASTRAESFERNAADLAASGAGAVFDHGEGDYGPVLAAANISGIAFREVRGLAPEFKDRSEEIDLGLVTGLAPHAPHTILMKNLARAASFRGPVSIHLGESPEEMGLYRGERNDLAGILLERGFSPSHLDEIARASSPVRRCEAAGLLTPRLLAVHAAQLGEEDLRRLAVRGVGIVLCPRSNAAIGVGRLPDLAFMRKSGMRVMLGTDSLASSPDLDPRREVLALLAAWPEIPAEEAWRMLALHAGRYLEHFGIFHAGRIEAGSPAPRFFAAPGAATPDAAARAALSAAPFRL